MFNILILLAVSIAAGYALRNWRAMGRVLPVSTTVTVLSLLIVFGMNIGSNESIISNLHHDGMKAVVIALLGVSGSIIATLLYHKFQRKEGRK